MQKFKSRKTIASVILQQKLYFPKVAKSYLEVTTFHTSLHQQYIFLQAILIFNHCIKSNIWDHVIYIWREENILSCVFPLLFRASVVIYRRLRDSWISERYGWSQFSNQTVVANTITKKNTQLIKIFINHNWFKLIIQIT